MLQYRKKARAIRAVLIEERAALEQEFFPAKTKAKRNFIYKKCVKLTERIHFLSQELGELCPDFYE